jgi:hypothetical protein
MSRRKMTRTNRRVLAFVITSLIVFVLAQRLVGEAAGLLTIVVMVGIVIARRASGRIKLHLRAGLDRRIDRVLVALGIVTEVRETSRPRRSRRTRRTQR